MNLKDLFEKLKKVADPSKFATWFRLAVTVVMFLGWAFAYLTWSKKDDGSAPPPVPDFVFLGSMGWVDDPDAVDAMKATLPADERTFAQTPAGRAVLGDDKDVLLSDVVKKIRGSHLPARNQGGVGSCVSFGSCTAIEYLIYSQMSRGDRLQFKDLCNEVMYGGSRVEIGGGRIRGDGSVTAWAGQFAQKYGVVPRGVHGQFDLSQYSEQRCRDWGRTGVPDSLEPVARQSPVKSITFANTAAEMGNAIRQGYSIAIGSQVGFGNQGPQQRDAQGFLRESGRWGHCMAVIGVRGGQRPGFLFTNSWGASWIQGPTGEHDIPPGSFWVDWTTAEKMAREGDCVVFSDAVGFPQRSVIWDVRKPRNRVDDNVPIFALGF